MRYCWRDTLVSSFSVLLPIEIVCTAIFLTTLFYSEQRQLQSSWLSWVPFKLFSLLESYFSVGWTGTCDSNDQLHAYHIHFSWICNESEVPLTLKKHLGQEYFLLTNCCMFQINACNKLCYFSDFTSGILIKFKLCVIWYFLLNVQYCKLH